MKLHAIFILSIGIIGHLFLSTSAAAQGIGKHLGWTKQGYGRLYVNPSSLDFGSLTLGTKSAKSILITNLGSASLSISQANLTGGAFGVQWLTLPLTLLQGQSTSFTVTFLPQSAGTWSDKMSLVSTASNSPTEIVLTGTSFIESANTTFAQLVINPTNLSFGATTLGTTNTLPIMLKNSGTATATISGANLTGTGFSLVGLKLPLNVAPGQSTSFSVSFTPTTSGTATGAVSVVSNADNSPCIVLLTGSGTTPVPHSAILSWTSSRAAVAGYNIYRSTQSGGPYSRINLSLQLTSAYIDSTVQGGQTYYYVATAVGSSGLESSYSNQVQAVIPIQ